MALTDTQQVLQILLEDQRDISMVRNGEMIREEWKERTKARTIQIREILHKCGLIGRKSYSEDAYKAMLTLVLHSGQPELMKKYLDIHTSADEGEVIISDRAIIIDKLNILKNGTQIFGTQFNIVDGIVTPLLIEDEENVDERRAGLGLLPLAEYIASINNTSFKI